MPRCRVICRTHALLRRMAPASISRTKGRHPPPTTPYSHASEMAHAPTTRTCALPCARIGENGRNFHDETLVEKTRDVNGVRLVSVSQSVAVPPRSTGSGSYHVYDPFSAPWCPIVKQDKRLRLCENQNNSRSPSFALRENTAVFPRRAKAAPPRMDRRPRRAWRARRGCDSFSLLPRSGR